MDIKVTIDISLSDDDISTIRRTFGNNKERCYNVYFSDNRNANFLSELINKDIVNVNELGNATLTIIGKLVFDQIDRDKKIYDILN